MVIHQQRFAYSWTTQRPMVASSSRRATSIQAQSSSPSPSSSSSWQSHVSTHPESTSALQKILSQTTPTNSNEKQLAFLFVGPSHSSDFAILVEQASQHFGERTLLVSVLGAGVIGEQTELDDPSQPCLSLLVGKLPVGANVQVQAISNQESIQSQNIQSQNDEDDDEDDDSSSYLLFADPWYNVESVINGLPASDIVAGGITCPTSTASPTLAIGSRVLPSQGSMVQLKLSGTLELQTLTAQGCRPVGQEFIITEVAGPHGNIITKLNDKPALEVLQNLANTASPEEQKLIGNGLLCGVVASSSKNTGDNYDYLSRQIMGFVPGQSGIAISSTGALRVGDRFCFQVRDSSIAEQDLEWMIQRAKASRMVYSNCKPLAALQISCVARGRGLFGAKNVDISKVEKLLDNRFSVAGFFANGEIGPVGFSCGSSATATNNRSYLHGFTTVAAVLCDSSSKNGKDNDGPSPMDVWG